VGAGRSLEEAKTRLAHLRRALDETPEADPTLGERALAIRARILDLESELSGDTTRAGRHEPTAPSITARILQVVYGHWTTTSAPTKTHTSEYERAAEAFSLWLPAFTTLVEGDLERLEDDAETAGAPWTPGRVPRWSPE
jgi:hypothetical protein